MKIPSTKTAMVLMMACCAALFLAPGCGTGAINTDDASQNLIDNGTDGGDQVNVTDKTSSTDTCDSMQVIPSGMGAYFRYDNSIWNSSDLLVRQVLREPIMDLVSGLPSDNGTMMDLLARFDELAVANLGFGPISTISCAVGGLSSKSGSFCSGRACRFGQLINGEIPPAMFLQQLFAEFVRDGVLKVSIEDFGSLPALYAFLEWGQENHIFQTLFAPLFGGVGDISVNPELSVEGPDFAQSPNPFNGIQLTMNEDGCISIAMRVLERAASVNLNEALPALIAPTEFLQVCQVDKFLLIATTAEMPDLKASAALKVAGNVNVANTVEGSSCNTNTFAALNPAALGIAPTQLMACMDIDKLNSNALPGISCFMGVNWNDVLKGGTDPCGMQASDDLLLNITRTVSYAFGRQPDMLRIGFGMTMDNPGVTSLLMQLYNPGSAGTAVIERVVAPAQLQFDTSVGGSSASAGYYDLMLRISASHSNALYEGIDPLKFQKILPTLPVDGEEIGLMSAAAQIIDSLNNYVLQFQADQIP